MHSTSNPLTALQIRNVGAMWRIYRGETVVAFATSYLNACQRLAVLEVRP